MKRITLAAVILSLMALGVGPATAQNGHDLFQQALLKERAEGELAEAIRLYTQIVQDFATDRTLAARALVQMGQCYEKLGSTEAESAYRTVVRDFADQPELVAQAEARLAALVAMQTAAEAAEVDRQPTFLKIEIASKPQNGALSPDGETLAFVSGGALWVLPVHGMTDPDMAGEPRRLTESVGGWDNASQLTWSADGRWIAFNGEREEGEAGRPNVIRVVSTEEGEMRTVEVPGRGNHAYSYALALSPDGGSLAYSARGRSELEEDSAAVERQNIYTIPIDGGEPRWLDGHGSREPAYSPDGSRIAYTRRTFAPEGGFVGAGSGIHMTELFVIPSAGGVPVQVTEAHGGARGPVWSPDGRWIAFNYEPGQGNSSEAVWVVPVSATPGTTRSTRYQHLVAGLFRSPRKGPSRSSRGGCPTDRAFSSKGTTRAFSRPSLPKAVK